MLSSGEIKSEKLSILEIFKNWWFRIPEYQRPYVWESDQVNDLLDDLKFGMTERSDFSYFLGTFVFQSEIDPCGIRENHLLDGQQRMATILLLMAVIRDLSQDLVKCIEAKKAQKIVGESENTKAMDTEVADAKEKIESCQMCIYQKGNKTMSIPEQIRLDYKARPEIQKFIEDNIKRVSGTCNEEKLSELRKKKDISIRNMANAILVMRSFFRNNQDIKPGNFLEFLLNNVLMIYVSTDDLEDAIRLLTILNNHGVPLRNSDILKAINLNELKKENVRQDMMDKYAKMWEEMENALEDDFERFLNHVRTILLKDKPRSSLLKEFEEKIYRPGILHKGQETFNLIEKYYKDYCTLIDGTNYDKAGKNFGSFDNLVKVMQKGLPATDWVPPLLCYFEKFEYARILDFLERLDNKFSADWISSKTPTQRIEAMNRVIMTIEDAAKNDCVDDVINSDCFNFDGESLIDAIRGPVYGKSFARYMLLKLDYIFSDSQEVMNFNNLSVEHILPQNPAENSRWVELFSQEKREEWTDKLGNLVLTTSRKGAELGRLDYEDKRKKHYEKHINTLPNLTRVMGKYATWTPQDLEDNHKIVLKKICEHYGIQIL